MNELPYFPDFIIKKLQLTRHQKSVTIIDNAHLVSQNMLFQRANREKHPGIRHCRYNHRTETHWREEE